MAEVVRARVRPSRCCCWKSYKARRRRPSCTIRDGDGAVGCQYTWDLLGGKATAAAVVVTLVLQARGAPKKVSVSHMEHIGKAISGTVLSSLLLLR